MNGPVPGMNAESRILLLTQSRYFSDTTMFHPLASAGTRVVRGLPRMNFTVWSSMATISRRSAPSTINSLRRLIMPSGGSIMRLYVATTSLAVNAPPPHSNCGPSCHSTPRRSVKVYSLPSSETSHAVARSGATVSPPSRGSNCTTPLYIGCCAVRLLWVGDWWKSYIDGFALPPHLNVPP